MHKETDTQVVLTTVYQYLEKAKVDLQKEGSQGLLKNKGVKNKELEEFTNRLSSQYQKSSK